MNAVRENTTTAPDKKIEREPLWRWIESVPLKSMIWVEGFYLISILCVLIAASFIHANPSGMETHRQLGLPPCSLYVLTGRPCPSCGMTTSFTAITHGNFALAVRANWFGIPLYAVMLFIGIISAYTLITRKRLVLHRKISFLAVSVFVSAILLYGIVRFILYKPDASWPFH